MKQFFVYIIKLYRLLISPLFPSSCIYQISCSRFSIEVLRRHGFILGVFFSIARILSCNTIFSHSSTKERLHV